MFSLYSLCPSLMCPLAFLCNVNSERIFSWARITKPFFEKGLPDYVLSDVYWAKGPLDWGVNGDMFWGLFYLLLSSFVAASDPLI